jgi:hypothetical protein
MAHFARLDETNNVINVEVVDNNIIIDVDGNEQEQLGVDFLIQLYGSGIYKQTSYNATFRKNYAGLGDTYDSTRDAFISPQPYPSWVLDENSCRYEAPVPYPLDDKMYTWDESTTSWGLVTE